jgi:hypothetical protein
MSGIIFSLFEMTFRMASIEVLDYRKDGEVEARGDDARLISGGGAIFIPERADFSGNDGWIKHILAPRSAIPLQDRRGLVIGRRSCRPKATSFWRSSTATPRWSDAPP